MLTKTKIFMIGYFLPPWMASMLLWGDDRTSASFEAAPEWFYVFKITIQIFSIILLFYPFNIKQRPSILGLLISFFLIFSTFFTNPILDAEFILLSSSIEMAILAIFFLLMKPSAEIKKSDIQFLCLLFLCGFLIQIALYIGLGRLPSHSILDVFVRFNGITNDSLSTGLILPLFIPWVVKTKWRILKTGVLISVSILTGSLFSAVFVPVVTLAYAVYSRLYIFAFGIIIFYVSGVLYFYNLFSAILEIKILSIVTHLRFFLDFGGVVYQQSIAGCDEEFCESFVESGSHLNPLYMILMYALLLQFVLPLLGRSQREGDDDIPLDALRIFGGALLVGTLVHPVPLIPFAIPLFFVLTTLYLGRDSLRSIKTYS